jgi:UDP-3-O-[3-hydroxymyristoyl] glucosamine N-acyltransferase
VTRQAQRHTSTPHLALNGALHHPAAALTTGDIAAALRAELLGPSDLPIHHLEMLDRAGPGSLCFIGSARFAALWPASQAAAAVVARGIDIPGHDTARRAMLIVDDVDAAMVALLELFAPKALRPGGIHPTAVVDRSARLGRNVSIGAGCSVGPGATLADDVMLHAGVRIGSEVSIGRGTIIHPAAVIYDRCAIGAACIIHAGAVIGADGFGYRPAPEGRGVIKVPHLGSVEIGDDVEIGANTCIDRAKFGATTIGSGTKIDNLVQIAHNCRIGRSCIICGHVGLAGSVVLGDGVVLGGGVAIADHITIGAGARVGARSGVMNDIPPGQSWMGIPAGPATETGRNYAAFRRLGELMQRIRRYEKMLQRDSQ